MTRLVQIRKGNRRRVALVDEPNVRLLDSCSSIYELAHSAIAGGTKLTELARQKVGHEAVDYELYTRGYPNGGCFQPLTIPMNPPVA